MEIAVDLTPDMLIGLTVADARAAVFAAGRFTRVIPLGAPIPLDFMPGRITLTVSDDVVVEAWSD